MTPNDKPSRPPLLEKVGSHTLLDPLRGFEPVTGPSSPRLHEPPEDLAGTMDLERQPLDWAPVPLPDHPSLKYFPTMVLTACETGALLCHATDPAGRHLPVWLALLAAGAAPVDAEGNLDLPLKRVEERVISLCVDSLPEGRVEESIALLAHHGVRLLTAQWPLGRDGRREPTFRPLPLLEQARQRAHAELDPLLGEALHASAPAGRVAWLEGRLRRMHLPGLGPDKDSTDNLHVLGVEREHERDMLHPNGARCRLDLAVGQRTPAFVLPGYGRARDLVSWYVRLHPANRLDPESGLVRVEATRGWWENHQAPGVDAASAWMVHLRQVPATQEGGSGDLRPLVALRAVLRAGLGGVEHLAAELTEAWDLATNDRWSASS